MTTVAAPPRKAESATRLRRVLRPWPARIAAAFLAASLLVAFAGELFAPESPAAQVGVPFATPTGAHPLGLDYLGEDVLSRVLAGGRTVILLGGVATVTAYLIGGIVGLTAGYSRGVVDSVLMRAVDVLLAFPPVILLLVIATGFGSSVLALVAGIVAVQVPGIARIIRTAALEVSVRGYVEAAVVRGDPARTIIRREILPNTWGAIMADAGPRFTVSILLVAALNFLGLGLEPPAADWSLMISENRQGITVNSSSVLAPAVMIGMLTVSLNVLADAVARTLGTSIDVEALRR